MVISTVTAIVAVLLVHYTNACVHAPGYISIIGERDGIGLTDFFKITGNDGYNRQSVDGYITSTLKVGNPRTLSVLRQYRVSDCQAAKHKACALKQNSLRLA